MNLNDTTTALARAAHTLAILPPDLPAPMVTVYGVPIVEAAWFRSPHTIAVLAAMRGQWRYSEGTFRSRLEGVDFVVTAPDEVAR